MKATLLFPNVYTGERMESLTIFAARRCRTTKSQQDLWAEVSGYSSEKRANFLKKVVHEEWAADILEMEFLIYDLEDIPMWLIVELLRHRLIAREFSLEQLSQRAIEADRLSVSTQHPRMRQQIEAHHAAIMKIAREENLPPEELRKGFVQDVNVNLVIAGNMRAFMHFWFMRSSPLMGGKGGAHKDFMELADSMQEQARRVFPLTMAQVLPA